MWSVIRETLIYLCFVLILCLITYSNRNQNSFLQVNHLRKFFLNTRQLNQDYTKVRLFCFLTEKINIWIIDFNNKGLLGLVRTKFC
jgi:hypothetical protein